MQAADEYQKAVENQIVMIEELLTRLRNGMRTWRKTYDAEEWRDATEQSIQRLEEDLAYFHAERERLRKAKQAK